MSNISNLSELKTPTRTDQLVPTFHKRTTRSSKLTKSAYSILGISITTIGSYENICKYFPLHCLPSPTIVINIASILLLISILSLLASRASIQNIPAKLSLSLGKNFFARPICEDDLDVLYDHYEREFGNDIVPKDRFTQWVKKCPLGSWKVTEKNDNQEIIVGYFDLFPLTKKGAKKLRQGERKTLQISDIASDPKQAKSFYVSAIGACEKSRNAKAAILGYMETIIAEYANEKTISIYARPVSSDGRNLVIRHQFKKINKRLIDSETYWRRDIEKGINSRLPSNRKPVWVS